MSDVKCDIYRSLNRTNEKFNFRTSPISKRSPNTNIIHCDKTLGKPGITFENGKFKAMIHYKHPITMKDTTKTSIRLTLEEALISRNEIAATLLRNKFISLDKFTKFTS